MKDNLSILLDLTICSLLALPFIAVISLIVAGLGGSMWFGVACFAGIVSYCCHLIEKGA